MQSWLNDKLKDIARQRVQVTPNGVRKTTENLFGRIQTMPNKTPAPKYKKGDRVIQRTSHRKFASLLTGSEMYKPENERKMKPRGPKAGVLISDAKRDKPQRDGKRHFYYHVKWDVNPNHENTVQQNTIKLEDSQ